MLATVAVAWSFNRAAGIAALLLASGSVVLGVLAASGGVKDARAAHEALSLATIAAIGAHGAAFLLDPFFAPGVAGALIPGASPYRAIPVALGQIAGYGLAALGLTYYARGRIGPARWRAAHRLSGVFWVLAVVHVILTGTDIRAGWFVIAALSPVAAGAVALALRWHERYVPRATA
jgi:sulfoxide reductase heme-binding subunit YedZ